MAARTPEQKAKRNAKNKAKTPEQKAQKAEYMRGYYARNGDKIRAQQNARGSIRSRKPIDERTQLARIQKLRKWGEAEDQLQRIANQNICDACGTDDPGKNHNAKVVRMCLDHCHTNNIFRGVLCTSCNIMLGFVERKLSRFPLIGGGLKNYAIQHGVVYG